MLRVDAALKAGGRVIQGSDQDSESLKAECRRVHKYDDAEPKLESGSPIIIESGPKADNFTGTENELDDEGDNNSQSDPNTISEQANKERQTEAPAGSKGEPPRTSDSSTIVTVRRFVMRALAENGTRTRVYGEPASSSPHIPPTPDSDPAKAEDLEDMPSIADDKSEEDGSNDLQFYHLPPMPVASLAWVQKNKPAGYGEPVGGDESGKEALRACR